MLRVILGVIPWVIPRDTESHIESDTESHIESDTESDIKSDIGLKSGNLQTRNSDQEFERIQENRQTETVKKRFGIAF